MQTGLRENLFGRGRLTIPFARRHAAAGILDSLNLRVRGPSRVYVDIRRVVFMALRVSPGVLIASAILLATPAFSHENHQELGAGPGGASAAVQPVEQAETARAHEEKAAAHGAAMNKHAKAADRSKSFGERLASWLGRLHPSAAHFPIAMLIGTLGVELYALRRPGRGYQLVARVMLVVGTMGAVVAAFLGWFAGGFYLTDRNPVLMVHRWLGTGIAVAGIILLLLSWAATRRPERPRTVYWAVLGVVTAAIAVQGYLGGTFMHGGMGHMAF